MNRLPQIGGVTEADSAKSNGSSANRASADAVGVATMSIDLEETEVSGAEGQVDHERLDSETISASESESENAGMLSGDVSGVSLLLEVEPAHRVFFQNLTDLLLFRSSPPLAVTSEPAPFWGDVFVQSRVPWWWFLESLLGHMIVVTAMLIVSQKWPASQPVQKSAFNKAYVYYTSPKTFPALGSNPPKPRAQSIRQSKPAHRTTIRVAQESRVEGRTRGQATLTPPQIPAGAKKLTISGPNLPTPMMPLQGTGQSHLTLPGGPTWIVAPPRDSTQTTGRGPGMLRASVAPPAPEIDGVASSRARASGSRGAAASVVGPPPSVSGSVGRAGQVNIGESAVVRPAPQLPMSEQRAFSATTQAGMGNPGSGVVPPAPSVQGSGILSGGRGRLLEGAGTQVVAPAPSVQAAGSDRAGGRSNSLASGNLQVVPPAPLVPGMGGSGGNGRLNSFSDAGSQAVPPAPSMQGGGVIGSSGRASGLGGADLQVVPPAPSTQGEGRGGGNGRANSLAGKDASAELQSAAGPSSVAGAGSSAAGGTDAGKSGTAQGKSAAIDDSNQPATLEMPLRLIGPVLALPGSSYFSNYEVYIAERPLAKDRSQLIKLVYVSLPYQRRLSEYALNSKIYKLRVTRDQSCDESLLQMTWPETDPRPDVQHSSDSPALSNKDRSGMLPCYRTTADDYRRAFSRSR